MAPTTPTFCEEAWAATALLQEAIATHPFNVALADGSLDSARFAHYLVQDSHYLVDFSRALDVAAHRAPDPGDAALLAEGARQALEVERSLHTGELRRRGVEAGAVPASPTCLAYGSWLQAIALQGPFEVQVASVLPCYWIYLEVGRGIHTSTAEVADHPYRAWIETYADEGFAASVGAVRALADRCAASASPATAAAMLAAFGRASELEWMFWDAAWRRERWPTATWLS